jgi:hypothetical protein
MFFAGAALNGQAFPTTTDEHLRQITRSAATTTYAKAFPKESTTTVFSKLNGAAGGLPKDPQLKQWDDYRNILAHWAAPGRVIYASGHRKPKMADWKIETGTTLTVGQTPTSSRSRVAAGHVR